MSTENEKRQPAFSGYLTTQSPVKPLDLESDEPLAPPECPLRKPGGDEPCEACQ